jgi:hypothetical protein
VRVRLSVELDVGDEPIADAIRYLVERHGEAPADNFLPPAGWVEAVVLDALGAVPWSIASSRVLSSDAILLGKAQQASLQSLLLAEQLLVRPPTCRYSFSASTSSASLGARRGDILDFLPLSSSARPLDRAEKRTGGVTY